MRSSATLLAALTLVGVLSACSAGPNYDFEVNPTPTPGTESAADKAAQELVDAYTECMTLAGWAPTEGESGLVYSFAPEQQDAYMTADGRCMKESGLNDPQITSLRIDTKAAYESVVNMHACLTIAEFDIEDPPSYQTFVDQKASWTPYSSLPVENFAAADAVCPQNGF